MDTTLNHVMAKYGILTAFTIEKMVSKEEMRKLSSRARKKAKKKSDFNKCLTEEIVNSTKESFLKNLIPGLIPPTEEPADNSPDFAGDEKQTFKLQRISNAFSKKLIDNKLSKDGICYVILGILGALGITDSDFRKFDIHDSDEADGEGEFPGQ